MRIHKTATFAIFVLFCAFSFLSPLKSQETRGALLGRVTDQTGAVVVGAKVTATNVGTGVRAESATNGTGDFTLPFLIPGTYTLTVQNPGFNSYRRAGIEVQVNDRITIDVPMQVGNAEQSVEVTAESPILDTSTATLGQVLPGRSIEELPLKDGMPLMMATGAPGVLFTVGNGSAYTRPFDTGSPSGMTIDGVRQGGFEVLLDGASIMGRNQIAYSPPGDIVQEFKIQTANWDVTFGFLPGAALSMSLKSGTNTLHGNLYDFAQNPAFDANKFFNNLTGLPKPNLRIDRWGLNATGPVVLPKLYNGHDKTFFMYAYEGIWSFDPTPPVVESVPTPAQRKGDFSALLAVGPQYQIYDPYSGVASAGGHTTRTPLPNNIITPSRINPVAQRIINLYDPPNLPGTKDGTNNYTAYKNAQDNYWNHIARIDHMISEKQRFFARADFTTLFRPENKRHNNMVGDMFLKWNRGAALDYVYVFSPSTFLDVRGSFTGYTAGDPPYQSGWDLAGLGFSPTFINQIVQNNGTYGVKLPDINNVGYSPNQASAGGLSWQTLTWRHDYIYEVGGNMTSIIRAHTLRYGLTGRLYRENYTDQGNSSGTFTFDTNWTRGPLDTSGAAPLGQSMADFLYGLPTSGGIVTPYANSYAEQNKIIALFLQDDWKITSKLTASFGLRYELPTGLTERYNRSVQSFNPTAPDPLAAQVLANYAKNPITQIPVSQFNPNGGLTFPGVNGNSRNLYPTAYKNFMPRLGVAYRLTDKTVIRTGAGFFFEPIGVINVHANQIGFSGSTIMVPSLDNGQSFAANLTNPFPGGILQPVAGVATYYGQSISFFNQNLKNPYNMRWSFAVQRELPWRSVLELSYVGNKAVRLRLARNLNTTPGQYLSTSPTRDQATINLLNSQVANPFYPLLPSTGLGSATVALSQLLSPYPQYVGAVSEDTNQGNSWYHALEVRAEKRIASGLSATLSYTWSKLMEGMNFKNAFDIMPERAISSQDRTNHVSLTFLYELPFGKGKRWVSSSRPLNGLIGGWQLQSVYAIQTGPPIGFGDALFVGNPNTIPLGGDQRSVSRWFNTSGFVTASSLALANNVQTFPSMFSYIRADGQNQADISFLKNTQIRENVRMQFRVEAINALNHPQFSPPNTTPTSSAFGQVTTEWSWPRVIQFGLKIQF